MLKKVSLILLFFLINSSTLYSRVSITPSKKNCSFYLDFEKERQCSSQKKKPSEYLATYGYKYCSRFLRERVKWKGKLKKWNLETGVCLQEMLYNNKRRIKPCSQLESFAFDVHPICYKQYGFCELESEDRQKIFKILSKLDIAEKFKINLVQFINISLSCSFSALEYGEIFFDFLFAVTRGASKKVKQVALEIIENAPIGKGFDPYFKQAFFEIKPRDMVATAKFDVVSPSLFGMRRERWRENSTHVNPPLRRGSLETGDRGVYGSTGKDFWNFGRNKAHDSLIKFRINSPYNFNKLKNEKNILKKLKSINKSLKNIFK